MIQTRKYTILLCLSALILMLLASCKDKQEEVKEVAQEKINETKQSTNTSKNNKKVILCFGNSLTAGYGLDEPQAWPSLLQNKIDSLNMDYTVVNAGLSGETSAGGLSRIDWVLNQNVDVFFLELGANDMLRGLDVTSTYNNLKGILDKVEAKYPGIPIVIAGMYAPPSMGPNYEQSFNKIFPDLAKSYNAKLIPFFLEKVAGIDSLNLPDHKHPNAKGQKLVLETVWASMENIL